MKRKIIVQWYRCMVCGTARKDPKKSCRVCRKTMRCVRSEVIKMTP